MKEEKKEKTEKNEEKKKQEEGVEEKLVEGGGESLERKWQTIEKVAPGLAPPAVWVSTPCRLG